MSENKSKRKRPVSAFKMDIKIQEACAKMLLKQEPISARAVAKDVGISTTSITRDAIRSKLVADAKRQQLGIKDTLKRQLKSSRGKDAEIITSQQISIEKLKREKYALLLSHKAMYGAIREEGSAAAYNRFLEGQIF